MEVVFYGADQGEDVANSGAPYEVKYTDTFARSMPVADAMNPVNILCYEMNGAPLPAANGYPLRLIAPGWFGIANVKWLTHVEVIDRRYPGRFMSGNTSPCARCNATVTRSWKRHPWGAC